jgi:hypothetical protein
VSWSITFRFSTEEEFYYFLSEYNDRVNFIFHYQSSFLKLPILSEHICRYEFLINLKKRNDRFYRKIKS